jgi:uncharacterized protein YaiI (UPF0178 family)
VVIIVNKTMRILVDADACPVKDEIARVGRQFHAEVIMVASYDHRLAPMDQVTIIQVDRSDQSVDLYIANRLSTNDIMVTQDFGLATIGLAKRAIVLSNRGQQYTDETIDYLLARRHDQAKKRRNGQHSKGPKPFTEEDRNLFQQCLTKILAQLQENSST